MDLYGSLVDDLEEIEAAVAAFQTGRESAYQTVAIQLRNLLADTSRAGPLLERVIADATLERLRPKTSPDGFDPSRHRMTFMVDCRGVMRMSTGPPYLTVTLDVVGDDLVPIHEWLEDWIVHPDVIIRDLIYQVASKEVAPTDDDIGDVPAALETNQIFTAGGQQRDVRPAVITGIGEYVARRARTLLGSA